MTHAVSICLLVQILVYEKHIDLFHANAWRLKKDNIDKQRKTKFLEIAKSMTHSEEICLPGEVWTGSDGTNLGQVGKLGTV